MQSVPSVPVGTTTLAGFATTLTGLVMAIIALTQGNATQDVVGAVIGGTLAVGSAIATLAGRYAQAHALAKRQEPQPVTSGSAEAVSPVGEPAKPAAKPRSHAKKPTAPGNHPNVPAPE